MAPLMSPFAMEPKEGNPSAKPQQVKECDESWQLQIRIVKVGFIETSYSACKGPADAMLLLNDSINCFTSYSYSHFNANLDIKVKGNDRESKLPNCSIEMQALCSSKNPCVYKAALVIVSFR